MATSDEHVALLNGNPSSRSGRLKGGVKLGLLLSLLLVGAVVFCYWDPYTLLESWPDDAAEVPAPVNFIAVGDWGRHGRYNQSRIAQQMGKVASALGIDFVVSTGDNFYKSGLTGVEDVAFEQSFSNIYTSKSLQKPWHAVLGNHDYRGDVLAQLDPWLAMRDPRWHCLRDGQLSYSLTQTGVAHLELFLIDTTPFVDYYWTEKKHPLDGRGIFPRRQYIERQLRSLAKGLNESTATWKVVVGHHTIRSYGKHGDTVELVQRVLPILERNNVDIYLNGHDHCLQHIKRDDSSLHFVTSGGGSKAWKGASPSQNSNGLQYYFDGQGFVSVSAAPTWLHVTYYNILGEVVHKLRLSKPSDSYE